MISTANTVITGKTLGCIQVSAPGVVIRNSRISCSGGGIAVTVDDRVSTSTVLTIEDSEITCNGPGTGLSEADFTLRRVNIHDCENGLDVNQNVTIEDSYIHDLYNGGGSHADGIQFASRWNGSTYVKGVDNVTIRHTTIFSIGPDGSFGTSAIISNTSGDQNVSIDSNLLAGGAYTLYCEGGTLGPAQGTNYRVTNNHFTTRFKSTVGFYGPTTGCGDETASGNAYHETGLPVPLN